jgi:hypothetical protein
VPVVAHAEHDQEHDRGGLAVEPDPHHGAIEDQADDRLLGERAGIPRIPIAFHLPPHPAHRSLADRTAKDGRECPPHPTRIGPGKIGADNQRIGVLGSPLVSAQRRTLPLGCLALRAVEPGARRSTLPSWTSKVDRPGIGVTVVSARIVG